MVDSILSDLDAAGALSGAELMYLVQSGADKKVTTEELAAFAAEAFTGGVGMVWPGYVAGRWYTPLIGVNVATGTALAQDAIRFHPLILHEAVTISELGARMTTNAASQNVQFAVYAADPATNRPTGNALGATGNVSTNGSTGMISGALAANAECDPGLHFLAINSSSATPVFQVSASANGTFGAILGSTTLANLSPAAGSNMMIYSLLSKTFGTWPDVTAETFNETSTTDKFAWIFFKVASVP